MSVRLEGRPRPSGVRRMRSSSSSNNSNSASLLLTETTTTIGRSITWAGTRLTTSRRVTSTTRIRRRLVRLKQLGRFDDEGYNSRFDIFNWQISFTFRFTFKRSAFMDNRYFAVLCVLHRCTRSYFRLAKSPLHCRAQHKYQVTMSYPKLFGGGYPAVGQV